MTRPARALIDIPALRHNFQQVRNSAPGRGILAVIKADAYGHGAARVARALDEWDGFAVARIQEGEALRAIGITKPVLLLSGVSGRDEHVGSIAYELVTRIAPRIARESIDDDRAQQPATGPSPGESR